MLPFEHSSLHQSSKSCLDWTLTGANLEGTDLTGAYFGTYYRLMRILEEKGIGAGYLVELRNCIRVILEEANLRNANLSGADLSWAILDKAKLTGAKLHSANLTGACLRNAELSEVPSWLVETNSSADDGKTVEFHAVDLTGAKLDGADFSGAKFNGLNLSGVDFSKVVSLTKAEFVRADLSNANLSGVDLREASFRKADLTKADLTLAKLKGNTPSRTLGSIFAESLGAADLTGASLHEAILRKVDLSWMNLCRKDLSGAKLEGSDLSCSNLVETDFSGANLEGCRVYGASAWGVKLDKNTIQKNLIITPREEPEITVDSIKVAQFIYLLLDNKEIRDAIDTITPKIVLILGRFSHERKPILNELREALRFRNYVPIMFDFAKPTWRDSIETIRILAGIGKFVIADLTEAKSVLQELQAIVPQLPSVPVRFLIKKSERQPGMLDHISRFPSVIKGALEYESFRETIDSIEYSIIGPVERKLQELMAP